MERSLHYNKCIIMYLESKMVIKCVPYDMIKAAKYTVNANHS